MNDYYAKCICGDCRGLCDVSFGPYATPFYESPICEDCAKPVGECHVCGEERHLTNWGETKAGWPDLLICIYCQEEIERIGRLAKKRGENL